MSSRTVKIFSLALVFIQSCGLINIFFSYGKDAGREFTLLLFSGFIVWFAILMIASLFVWYMSNENTVKKDIGALVFIFILTLLSLSKLLAYA